MSAICKWKIFVHNFPDFKLACQQLGNWVKFNLLTGKSAIILKQTICMEGAMQFSMQFINTEFGELAYLSGLKNICTYGKMCKNY